MKKQIKNKTFIEELLDEDRINNVDWIKCGKHIRHIVNPPRNTDKENNKYFSKNLKTIIPVKLKEALEAKESLKRLRKKRIKLITDRIPPQYQWFYLLFEASLFSEFYTITKWIDYWLNLWFEIKGESYSNYNRRKGPISDGAIRRAKDYPIEHLYEGKLRRSGERFNGLCPFHQEKTPSFFIFPDNHWHCFGACSEGGDAISFVMKLNNLDFVSAVKRLNHE